MNATSDDPKLPDTPEVKNLEFKAALLLVAMLVLVIGSALYGAKGFIDVLQLVCALELYKPISGGSLML